MSFKNFIQSVSVVAGLATSPISHAGDIFEPQVLTVEEACAGRTNFIINGKDLCAIPKDKKIETSLDNGATWHPLYGVGSLALALSTVGVVAFLTRKKTPPKRPSNRTEPEVSEGLPVLTDEVVEAQDTKDLIREAILSIEGVIINEDFKDSGYTDVITFSLPPEENSAMETDYIFKILIEKEIGRISFHRYVPSFMAMKKDGKWKNTAMPQYVTVENIKSYFETLSLLPLYGRKPGE